MQFEKAARTGEDSAEYVMPENCPDYESPIDRYNHPLHEVRWLFTALYMMAQKLSIQVQHPTSRAVRRRLERNKEIAPDFVRVITLRRLAQARERDGASADVNWKWQWGVRGHWRNQFYPTEGIHKPKFVESYIKGPENMPLKPESLKLFVAKR